MRCAAVLGRSRKVGNNLFPSAVPITKSALSGPGVTKGCAVAPIGTLLFAWIQF
jgi:hypothetical protein